MKENVPAEEELQIRAAHDLNKWPELVHLKMKQRQGLQTFVPFGKSVLRSRKL